MKVSNREKLENIGRQVLDASRTELYIAMRFMGEALSSLSFEMDLSTTTIGTDAISIRYNPTYVSALFIEEPGKLNRTYLHMVLHCIFRHMYTSAKYEDTRLYDLCADIVVESILDDMDYQCIYRVTSDYRDSWYERLKKELKVLTVEKLYRFFSDKENAPCEDETEKLEREFRLDDHGFWLRLRDGDDAEPEADKDKEMPPLDDDYNAPENGKSSDDNDGKKKEKYISPRRLKKIQNKETDWEKSAKRMLTEIETIGKKSSDRLGKLSWLLKYENTSRTDYQEFLKRFMVIREEGGIDMDSFDYGMYSFGLQHYGNMPLIEENEFREVNRVKELVIAIDTSASCKEENVQRFLNETGKLLLSEKSFFQKIKIHLIQCDNQVQSDELIESVSDMEKYAEGFCAKGGFGTDFRPVFEYVDGLLSKGEFDNLKGLIYFTDGYGDYPEKETSFDTAFVFTKDEDYEDENVPDWAIKLYI